MSLYVEEYIQEMFSFLISRKNKHFRIKDSVFMPFANIFFNIEDKYFQISVINRTRFIIYPISMLNPTSHSGAEVWADVCAAIFTIIFNKLRTIVVCHIRLNLEVGDQ